MLCETGIDTYAGTSRRGSGQLTAQWSKEPQLKQGTVGFFSCGWSFSGDAGGAGDGFLIGDGGGAY